MVAVMSTAMMVRPAPVRMPARAKAPAAKPAADLIKGAVLAAALGLTVSLAQPALAYQGGMMGTRAKSAAVPAQCKKTCAQNPTGCQVCIDKATK